MSVLMMMALGSVFPVAEFSFSTVLLNNERLPAPVARPTSSIHFSSTTAIQKSSSPCAKGDVDLSFFWGRWRDIVSNEESMTSRAECSSNKLSSVCRCGRTALHGMEMIDLYKSKEGYENCHSKQPRWSYRVGCYYVDYNLLARVQNALA